MNRSYTDPEKRKADLLWKNLGLEFNYAAGYVSYKNLNSQFGSKEKEFEVAEEIEKVKDISDWKKSYGGFKAVKERGFCISKVTDPIFMRKVDELHQIMASKPFDEYEDTNPVFNSMRWEHSEKLREYNKPPYDTEELKIDGGRNMLLVSNLQDSDPMERRGKLLSKEIGEHLRVKILKGLQASTTVKRKDGMVLTWLETQGPKEDDDHKVHKVVSQCLSCI